MGLVAPIGRKGLAGLLAIIADEDDARLPAATRSCLSMLAAQLQLVNAHILENDRAIRQTARASEVGRRLMQIPGVGPLLASAFVASVPEPSLFKSGRNLAAWIGLVPKQNSSSGKERLGGITKQGNRYLRQLLVVGALAVIRWAQRHGTRRPWLIKLMSRRTTKVAAVALANKSLLDVRSGIGGVSGSARAHTHGCGFKSRQPSLCSTGVPIPSSRPAAWQATARSAGQGWP